MGGSQPFLQAEFRAEFIQALRQKGVCGGGGLCGGVPPSFSVNTISPYPVFVTRRHKGYHQQAILISKKTAILRQTGGKQRSKRPSDETNTLDEWARELEYAQYPQCLANNLG